MNATQLLFPTALFMMRFLPLKVLSGAESTSEFTLGQHEKLVLENKPSLKTC